MTVIRRIFLMTALLVFSLLPGSAQAQSTPAEFLGNPGYWVRGAFLQFYQSTPHAARIFGDPITTQLRDPVSQRTVQYFENARFELVERETGSAIQLTPLGEQLFDPERYPTVSIAFDPSVCERFENGIDVCYAFWQFYQQEEGAYYLGQPLSPVLTNSSGFLLQYFENGSLEWHPERPAGQRVTVTPSGRLYLEQLAPYMGDPVEELDGALGQPAPLEQPASGRVFVAKAIMTANNSQIVSVVVKDPYHQPVPGAVVGLTVTMPDGKETFFRLPETNASGISTLELVVGDFSAGSVVLLEALISTPAGTTSARGWFRLWW